MENQTIQCSNDFAAKIGNVMIKNYFEHNFGSMAKSDLETLLFHLYVEDLKGIKAEIDDYTISKALGITQSRVRALKERSTLKYSINELDLKEGILNVIKSAYYCKTDKKIHCFINDVIAQIEIRHYLETRFMFDEFSLNPKVMILTPKAFFEVCDPMGRYGDIINKNLEMIKDDLRKLKLQKKELNEAISKIIASPTPWNLFSVIVSNPIIEENADNLILKIKNSITDSKIADSFKKMLGGIFKK